MARLFKVILSLLVIIIIGAVGIYIYAGWTKLPMDEDARSNAPGSFLETSQGKVHYQWYGKKEAPVIVMVHGFSTPGFIYRQNADALAATGFRVLTFDHLGRGWSDRPHVQYDDQFYERELLDVLDGLAVKGPIGLVGLSMGGVTTSYFAARHPERVDALFLFVPAGFNLATDPESVSTKILMTPIIGDWIWRVFGEGILLGDDQYDESKLEPGSRLQGDVAEQMKYEGYLQALLSTYRNMQMYDRKELFRKLQATDVPVTALFGAEDTTVLPSSQGEFDKAIPRANSVMVEGGGHGLNYQRPEQSNAYLISFFETHLKKKTQ
jgi:pimeloyl-ACP methyl ester carboxylesterase